MLHPDPTHHSVHSASPRFHHPFITVRRALSLHTILEASHLARGSGPSRTDPLWRAHPPLIRESRAAAPQRIRRLLALAAALGLPRAQLLALPTHTHTDARRGLHALPSSLSALRRRPDGGFYLLLLLLRVPLETSSRGGGKRASTARPRRA